MGVLIVVFAYTNILADVTASPTDQTLSDSVVVLESAINALVGPHAEYRKILQHVTTSLPADSHVFIKNDITTFLRRVPAAEADFKCSPDFVRFRARKELLRLRDTLLNDNPQPARPQFCYAVPYALDVLRPVNSIEIYGYDFDREPLQVLLMNDYGFRDVTFTLVQRTHYHLTLEFHKNRVTLSPHDRMLALVMGHLIHHAIPIIQTKTPLCSSRFEELRSGREITYQPLLIHHEGAFNGIGATVLANAALDYRSNIVDITICVTAVEQKEHQNAVSGCGVQFIYSTDSDRAIEWVFGELEAGTSYNNGMNGMRAGARGSPITEWKFTGFDAWNACIEPELSILLRSLQVVSSTSDGCISAIAYMEAKRANALSVATIRRMAPQLQQIEPAILKLRPRFAPAIR
jgi:hypothetical protein